MPALIAAIIELGTALLAIIKLLGAIALVAGLFELLFDPKGSQRVGNLLGNIIRGTFAVASPVLSEFEAALAPVGQAILTSLNSNGSSIVNIFKDPAAAVAKTAFTDAAAALSSVSESTADNAVDQASAAMGNAFGFGLSSAAVSAAFEAAFPEKLNTLNGIGPMLAQMAGFEEVAAAVRGPLYDAAFGRSLQYHFRSKFKPELPREFDAVLWHARRLLTEDQLKEIFDKSGLKAEYESPFITSAYRAVAPFIISRAAAAGAMPHDDLEDVLEFNGFRPVDVARLLDAFAALA